MWGKTDGDRGEEKENREGMAARKKTQLMGAEKERKNKSTEANSQMIGEDKERVLYVQKRIFGAEK